MMVKRIVTNIAATDVSKAKQFYVAILGLDIVMDQGWIATFASRTKMAPQISIATEGGSGTPVPDISVEVDDLEEAKRRVLDAGLVIAGKRGVGRAALLCSRPIRPTCEHFGA